MEANKPKREVTLDHRLLMLHYLGALDKIRKADNATKQGAFLEYLIQNDGEKIRQRFSSIHNLFPPVEKTRKKKLKEDLLQVQDFFKELGLRTIVKNIQADLRKLDQ